MWKCLFCWILIGTGSAGLAELARNICLFTLTVSEASQVAVSKYGKDTEGKRCRHVQVSARRRQMFGSQAKQLEKETVWKLNPRSTDRNKSKIIAEEIYVETREITK